MSLLKSMASQVLDLLTAEAGEKFRESWGDRCAILIGGGAVNWAIHKLMGLALPPLNDIDVFLEATPTMVADAKKTKKTLSPLTFSKTDEVADGYGAVLTNPSGRHSLIATAREGLINYVYCAAVQPFREFCNNRDSAVFTLHSFDLNCTQVGLYVSKEGEVELLWTAAYAKFLQTRQVEVEDIYTPLHTAIRYLTKLKEMPNVFGNIPATMALLSLRLAEVQEFAGYLAEKPGDFRIPGQIKYARMLRSMSHAGKGYAAKLEKLRDQLGEYFDIPLDLCKDSAVFSMTPKKSQWVAFQEDLKILPIGLRSGREKALQDSSLVVAWNRANTGYFTKVGCEQIKRVLQNPERIEFNEIRTRGTAYFERQVSFKDLDSLNKLLGGHRGLASMFAGKTLEKKVWLAKGIMQAVNIHGQRAIGLLESAMFLEKELEEALACAASSEQFTKDLLTFVAKQIKLLGTSDLYKKMLPKGYSIDGYSVVDLNNSLDLMDEGGRQKHCVGGYGSVVARGSTLIISLRKFKDKAVDPQKTLTVAFTISKVGKNAKYYSPFAEVPPRAKQGKQYEFVQIAQSKGLQNRVLTPEENTTVGKLFNAVQAKRAGFPSFVASALLHLAKESSNDRWFSKLWELRQAWVGGELTKWLKSLNPIQKKVGKPLPEWDMTELPF